IELNGEAVVMNQAAFRWGRQAAVDLAAVEALVQPAATPSETRRISESPGKATGRGAAFLPAHQSPRYAQRYPARARRAQDAEAHYRALVERAKAAEEAHAPGKTGLADAVARYLFKLMAYKDEYEVARLYTDGAFEKQVAATFDGDDLRFEFPLAPPLLARRD